jgi:hypothetical protein
MESMDEQSSHDEVNPGHSWLTNSSVMNQRDPCKERILLDAQLPMSFAILRYKSFWIKVRDYNSLGYSVTP